MIVSDLHWTEIDSHVLTSDSKECVMLTCASCGSHYKTGDDWPGVCKCGGQRWDMGVFSDMRDLNLVSNVVVL